MHTFNGDNGKLFVGCQSGLCQRDDFGKKRRLLTLDHCENICTHLMMVREYYKNANPDGFVNKEIDDDEAEQYIEEDEVILQTSILEKEKWEDVFDEITGLWLFKSSYGHTVSTHPFSEKLSKNCITRLLMVSDILQGNPKDYVFYPTCKQDEICECGLTWHQGEFAFVCNSTLYTRSMAVSIQIYKLVCPNNSCTMYWTGEEDAIFRLSRDMYGMRSWMGVYRLCKDNKK